MWGCRFGIGLRLVTREGLYCIDPRFLTLNLLIPIQGWHPGLGPIPTLGSTLPTVSRALPWTILAKVGVWGSNSGPGPVCFSVSAACGDVSNPRPLLPPPPPYVGASAFVRDSRNVVDESATAPQEQSLFVKDRVAARKVGASSLETAARGGGGQGWGRECWAAGGCSEKHLKYMPLPAPGIPLNAFSPARCCSPMSTSTRPTGNR